MSVPTMGGDSKFWMFFGAIWLLVGLGFAVVSLGALLFADPADMDDPALLWVFLPVGLVLGAVGGFIIRRALMIAARDKRLMQSGIQLTATVTDVRRSPIDINRQARWHVHYRYDYSAGRSFEGRSRALPGETVESFKPGDSVLIKVDPRQPAESLFLGAPP
ncbi:MAG: DUF3592 domain-containing protein [Dongiaceae bacterium]